MAARPSPLSSLPAWRLAAALLAAGMPLAAQTVPRHDHVIVVALENHSYEGTNNGVVGSSGAPFYNNTLIAGYGLADNYYVEAHGSLSQYFRLLDGTPYCTTSGTLFCGSSQEANLVADGDSLLREVIAAGKSWKQYTDSLPSRGFIAESGPITGSNPTGTYYPRHAPAIYFSDVRQGTPTNQSVDCTGEPTGYDTAKQACNVVNFQDATNGFAADLSAGRLPNLSLVIPNGCHDAHDDSCAVPGADSWLATHIGPLLSSPYFQPGGDGLLIVWWDEGSLSGYTGPCGTTDDERPSATGCTGGGGRIAVVVAAPDAKPGFHSGTAYHHSSVTQTLAQALGVPVPAPAASAPAMADFFQTGSVPAPWQQADVGAVDLTGSASYSGGTFTVTAGGTDIWDTADAFHYVYQPLSGDGEIVADVSGLTAPPGATFALAGVMIREQLTADSVHATMMITTEGKAKFRRRTAEGGITASDGPSAGSTPPPRWLKVTRAGNVFSAAISSDGVTWTPIFTPQTISMSTNAYIGFLALRNGAGTPAASASLTHVSVNRLPSPWQGTDVGAVDLPGNASYTSGTFTVNAGGSDIWDTADAFYYVYQPLAGDGTIVADVTGLSAPSGATFALAGVMIREKLTANAMHATMMITTEGKAKFRRRATEGDITASDGPSAGSTPPPRWLKVTRAGNVFSAAISSDGATWTPVFTPQTIGMSTNAYIGFLVLRNGPGTPVGTGTLSNVTVTH